MAKKINPPVAKPPNFEKNIELIKTACISQKELRTEFPSEFDKGVAYMSDYVLRLIGQ